MWLYASQVKFLTILPYTVHISRLIHYTQSFTNTHWWATRQDIMMWYSLIFQLITSSVCQSIRPTPGSVLLSTNSTTKLLLHQFSIFIASSLLTQETVYDAGYILSVLCIWEGTGWGRWWNWKLWNATKTGKICLGSFSCFLSFLILWSQCH